VKPLPPGHTLQWLLATVFVFTIGFVSTALFPTGDEFPWLAAPLLVGVLALAAASWIALSRSGAEIVASQAAMVARQVRIDGLEARLLEFSSMQGRFVGNIAHEIKTPIAIVLGETDLLLRNYCNPEAVNTHARSISEEMRHLSDLVESFLALGRPFARTDKSHHIPVSVHDFVVEATRRSQSLARRSEVTVVPMLAEPGDDEGTPEVLGDSVLLGAMLENLLRNAVRFSPRGSRVEVQVDLQGPSIMLNVRDHGLGVAAEHLESVFDWSFQVPGLTQSSGTGFGLAIAKRVVEHHAGTITLQNLPAGGCEFQITLPRYQG
jgi:signal transduction histidine kinase